MIDDAPLDQNDIQSRRAGDDSTPLMALVRDRPYTRGGLTSTGRTNSADYAAFLRRKEIENARTRKLR